MNFGKHLVQVPSFLAGWAPACKRATLNLHLVVTILVAGVLAGCASRTPKNTGISRESAVSIAQGSCRYYPNPYRSVARAEWVDEKQSWIVQLGDESEEHGIVYKINREGQITGTKQFADAGDDDYWFDSRGNPTEQPVDNSAQRRSQKSRSAIAPSAGGMPAIPYIPSTYSGAYKPQPPVIYTPASHGTVIQQKLMQNLGRQ